MNRRQFPEALLIFSQIVENFPDCGRLEQTSHALLPGREYRRIDRT